MSKSNPVIVAHRRNQIEQLAAVPKGYWVEIDIEIHEDVAYLIHDPLTTSPSKMSAPPDRLADYIPAAVKQGVAGFVVDCKRENAEKWVAPIMATHGVTNFFYLNEMEVQADIFQSQDELHYSGIRIWKYRGAGDVIRLARDMASAKQNAPKWSWVDCWQRGLLTDLKQAYIPLKGAEAVELQRLGVRLCICSPELYVHKYGVDYSKDELAVFHCEIVAFRNRLESEGIFGDAFCTKFPEIWL